MKRSSRLFGSTVVIAASLLAALGCARPRNDAQIASDVQGKIYGDVSIHSRQLTVQSSNGVVTLFGSTLSDPERFAAAAEAAKVEGVKTVVNNLQVSPAAAPAQATVPAQPSANAVPAPLPAPDRANPPAPQSPANTPQPAPEPQTSAPPARRSASRHMEAATRRVAAKHHAGKTRASPTEVAKESTGLPYSTAAAPPSSPVGGNQPSQPAVAADNPHPSPEAAPSQQKIATTSTPATKTAAPPTSAAPTATTVPVAAVPSPPAPPKPVTISSGTSIAVRLLDGIDTEKNHSGDTFRATLDAPLVDEAGATVVPAGYEVTGKVVDAKSAGRFAGNSALALELTQLSVNGRQYSLQTNQYTKRGKSRGKSTAEKVGGGAALGAILGGIFGGAKGAAIGATVGAGAGTGVSAAGKGEQIVLPTETALTFELQSPLSVIPNTQSPHGTHQEQNAASTTGGSTADNASPGEDGPPVLKRRSQ